MSRKNRQLRAKLIFILVIALLVTLHCILLAKVKPYMVEPKVASETKLEPIKESVKPRAIVSRGASRVYSTEDMQLMAMIVHAEAEGEPLDGKILVATVIMNRQKVGGWFGNTIKEVILKRGQFDGTKRKCFKDGVYLAEDMRAVVMACSQSNQYLYFCNLETSTDGSFVNSMNWVLTIGNHSFAE